DCRKRTETNPIRVLDCKNPKCQEVAARAPKLQLCAPCAEHFAGLRRTLDALSVPYVLDEKLVRGLDYYTRTAYEAIATAGLAAEVSFRRSSAGNQLKRADALGARFALVLGDAELKSNRGRLKELASGAQHEIDLGRIVEELKRLSS